MEELEIQRAWDFINRSLRNPPEAFRAQFLAALSGLSGAADAFVVLTALPDAPQASAELHEVVADFLRSDQDTRERDIRIGPFRKIWIHRLRWNQSILGAVGLLFEKDVRGTVSLSPFLLFYSLYESLQEVLRLLDVSQKSLQTLTVESATLAREHSHLVQQMLSNQQRLQSISKGILRTQEEERAKVSRELHDGIGQALTGLKINLDLLTATFTQKMAAEESQRWNEVRSIADQSLQDVRELSRLLRPQMLDDLGLFPTLQWYVRNYSERMRIPVNLKLEGNEEALDPEIQTMLFRIAQEALTNIARHSQATEASLQLATSENRVRLTIIDNGKGFDVRSTRVGGSGLSGIHDRVSLFGGALKIESEPGRGSTLDIEVPVHGQD